jgi:glycosyltransferase involved in cell wall biosynthesis
MLKRRLLVLTPRYPYPAIGGDRVRILHLCRALAAQFRLTLLSLCESKEELVHEPQDGLFESIHRVFLPRWQSWLHTLLALPGEQPLQLAYYKSNRYRRAVRDLIPQHDAVLAHLIRTGQYLVDRSIPRILEMTDAISLNYLRVQNTSGGARWKKLVYQIERKRLQAYETNVVRNFDRVWLTSHADRNFLDPRSKSPIEVIPNGADLRNLPYRPPADQGNAIVFIGNMVTLQNQDACRYFIEEILPTVRSRIPAVFRIVGNAPDSIRRSFERYEGVELTGRVERIAEQGSGVSGPGSAVRQLSGGSGRRGCAPRCGAPRLPRSERGGGADSPAPCEPGIPVAPGVGRPPAGCRPLRLGNDLSIAGSILHADRGTSPGVEDRRESLSSRGLELHFLAGSQISCRLQRQPSRACQSRAGQMILARAS